MPDPNVPFPGANRPWPSWCLECGYGKKWGADWAPNSTAIKAGTNGCPGCAARPSWRHEEAADMIAPFGLTPLEKYPGTVEADWRVRCAQGHEFTTTLSRVREKHSSRCRECAGNMPYTDAEARQLFRDTINAEPDPAIPYPGYHEPWPCTCRSCGRRWETARLATVLKGHGCIECNHWTPSPINQGEAAAEAWRYGFETLPGHLYAGCRKRWLVRHIACQNPVPVLMASLRSGFSGCEHCSLGPGLKRSRPASIYILVHSEWGAVKLGVTGERTASNRLHEHGGLGFVVHCVLACASGYDAEKIERAAHVVLRERTGQTHLTGFVSREQMPNGHTETYTSAEVPPAFVEEVVGDLATQLGVEISLQARPSE